MDAKQKQSLKTTGDFSEKLPFFTNSIHSQYFPISALSNDLNPYFPSIAQPNSRWGMSVNMPLSSNHTIFQNDFSLSEKVLLQLAYCAWRVSLRCCAGLAVGLSLRKLKLFADSIEIFKKYSYRVSHT